MAYEGFMQLQDYQILRVKLRGVAYCFEAHSQSLPKASSNFATSVCPSAWNNSAPTGRFCVKYRVFQKDLNNLNLVYFTY